MKDNTEIPGEGDLWKAPARFKRIVAHLAFVLQAARPKLQELGIALRDGSNLSGFDWVQSSPSWSWDFVRTSSHTSYNMTTTATITVIAAAQVAEPDRYMATWRSEAWQNTNPNFHRAEGAVEIGPELLTFGSFERLVLALLRRAAPAFPEILDDAGWPGFADLPSLTGEVDHLPQIRAFHKEMVEPWTGPPAGCSETEIAALEAKVGWPLPLAYKQYLAFMGADRQGTFVGSDWFIESARLNTIDSALAYNEVGYTPSADTLTFMSHQGYMFGWLDLPIVSNDPPAYFYSESAKGNTVEHHTRFTDLLLAELKYISHYTRKVRDRMS